MTASAQTRRYSVRLVGDLQTFKASLTGPSPADDPEVVSLTLESPQPAVPPQLTLEWTMPVADIHGAWHPGVGRERGLSVAWGPGLLSRATTNAPVIGLHSQEGRNRLTFAASDALNTLELFAGVIEETAEFLCRVTLFPEPHPPIQRYDLRLLLDSRDRPYYEVLRHVQEWWAAQPGYAPSPVPATARLPMLSTWYSFHQKLEPDAVVKQCHLAKALGCEAVIVDDGWQTTDAGRGYAYCGDWEPERIRDMRGFVDAVHGEGMKFLLWYSVPFAGKHSQAFKRFADKKLRYDEGAGAAVLDPRFADVREYLIGLYERAMREWDLDGFKLDFVDCFVPSPNSQQEIGGGRDGDSVLEAADRLLSDIIQRLRKIKPDVMIEFRQSYIGPLMRKYGNMFRAGDCPNDAITNRVRTLDIRLLCGDTAAHADMLMWHPTDPVESAALQVLNVLFAVPQISVLLDKIPQAHVDMLRFWLKFWREHRDALLDGQLQPLHPESLYPLVIASTRRKRIMVLYGDVIANPGPTAPAALYIVNATGSDRVVIELEENLGERKVAVFDCCGREVSAFDKNLTPGTRRIRVPPSGLIACTGRYP